MLCAIGDLHLSDNRPWSYDVSRTIVKYIIDSPHNNPDNELVLLGDITESASMSGLLYDLLLNMFLALKYKTVYVLVGNHDKKPNKQGKLTLSYRFLMNRNIKKIFTNSDIRVIDTAQIIEIEGMKCLMLPYIFNDSGLDFSYYEHLPSELNQKYDILFGHFSDTSQMEFTGKGVDISYIKRAYTCLGHQHNPSDNYIGSVVPNSISEASKSRSIQLFTFGDKGPTRIMEPLPIISDYYTATFPKPLPTVEASIPIWTVTNCASPEIAIEHYGPMYITKCVYKPTLDFDAIRDIGVFENREQFTNTKLFEMFAETKPYADPKVIELARSYLLSS